MTSGTSIYEYAKQGLDEFGDLPAFCYYGGRLTFRELFERIDNIADHLYALGVGEGTVATIHLPNCPQAIMAVYAVAKLGGICNMVHALLPKAAVAEYMAFTESNLIITHMPDCCDAGEMGIYADISKHMGALARLGYKVSNRHRRSQGTINFSDLEGPCAERAKCPEQSSLAKKCAVYMQSTGTTGTPKTVMHSHEAINNWVEDERAFYRGESQAGWRMLCIFPPFHGSGLVLNIHNCVSNKIMQVLMARFSAKKAVEYLKKYRIEVITGIPTMYERLLREPGFNGKQLPWLRECFVSADYVPASLKERFDRRLDPSGRRHFLFEGYGMTEVITAVSTLGRYNYKNDASGYPFPGCNFAILENNAAKRVGSGELLIDANTAMLGYLKQPSQQVFIDEPGHRWYRTGDLGRIDEEGYIYFTGRIKDIIVHNGYNILPSEVEEAAFMVDAVAGICVLGIWDEENKTQQICAFVVVNRGQSERITEEKLMAAWRERLPRYAIPKRIRFLDELPRNRMGKTDKRALESIV